MRIFRDRSGVSSIEYAILAAAVLGVVALATTALGADITALFGKVHTILTGIIA